MSVLSPEIQTNAGIANRDTSTCVSRKCPPPPQLKLRLGLSGSVIIFARAGWRFIHHRQITLFGEPIQWVGTTLYLGVTLDKRLTLSPHIDQVRKRAVQWMGTLGPLLNRKSDLSVRNGVLLYKQLIRPVMELCVPRVGVQRLDVLQPKCFRLATGAPWYVSIRQIQEDLGVPLFANIRALVEDLLKVS